MRKLLPAAALGSALLLAGCSLAPTASNSTETFTLQVSGTVHGGQQPVSGAHVHLMAVREDIATPSVQNLLLATGQADAYGPYVTTSGNGSYFVTGQYTGCAAGNPVYVLVTQGNPGLAAGTDNAALAEMAPVGVCNGLVFSPTLQVGVTEVSTVATAYALAGYLTGPASLTGLSSALSKTGFNNAFSTAQALLDQPTGTVVGSTAAGATVPVARVNLLADAIAACVNTAGASSAACTSLFGNATADGSASGTVPADTITALLNIAHHPAANLAALYSLAAANGPYQPTPSTQPTDLTFALTFPSLSLDSTQPVKPNQPSVDAAGRVAIAGEVYSAAQGSYADVGGAAILLSSSGTRLNASRVYNASGTALLQPQRIAIDPAGSGWLANGALNGGVGGQVLKINLLTGAATSFRNAGVNGITQAIVSDAAGNIFQADNDDADQFVLQYSNAGALVFNWLQSGNWIGTAIDGSGNVFGASAVQGQVAAQFTGDVRSSVVRATNTAGPNSLALDSAGLLWVTNGSGNSISRYTTLRSPSGAAANLSRNATYSGGGLSFNTATQPIVPIAMDGASAAWVPNFAGTSISAFSNAGVALSPAGSGFQTGCPSKGLAVDGSGDVWVTCDPGANFTGPALIEFLGLATPVATPMLPGQYGVRP